MTIELGASIFVSANHLLVQAAKDFNIELKSPFRSDLKEENPNNSGFSKLFSFLSIFSTNSNPYPTSLGIWNGKSFVFESGNSWTSKIRFFLRYGLSYMNSERFVRGYLQNWISTLYKSEWINKGWTKASEILEPMNIMSFFNQSAYDLFNDKVSSDFMYQFLAGITRNNYGQNVNNIHAWGKILSIWIFNLIGAAVCLVASTDTLFASKNGNVKFVESFINYSEANVNLNSAVSSVIKTKSGKFNISIS